MERSESDWRLEKRECICEHMAMRVVVISKNAGMSF